MVGVLVFFIPLLTFAQSFTDVPTNHRYYVSIESLKNLEIVNGYADGSFKPEQPVNRAEALKMIFNSAEIKLAEVNIDTGFSDVPSDSWFVKYVMQAKNKGIVNGNKDGTFAPSRFVNKAEFVKMILLAFETDLSQHIGKTDIIANDVLVNQWFYPYLRYAKVLGITNLTPDNRLLPDKNLNRGECAEIIYKILVIKRGGDTQKMLSIAEANLVELLVALQNNNIDQALNLANNALFYTENALKLKPDNGTVKAAHKLVLGFKKLTLAYQSGVEKDYSKLSQYVSEAKQLAGDAYQDDINSQPLGKKIKVLGDVLLEQIAN